MPRTERGDRVPARKPLRSVPVSDQNDGARGPDPNRITREEEMRRVWKKPKIVEIAVGLEINSYACAEL